MTFIIRNWEKHFEKAESRKCKTMIWLSLPTNLGTREFRKLAKNKDGAKIFSAWIVILQIAASMPVRGVLSDSKGDLDESDFSALSGFPEEIFKIALPVLISKQIGWIENSKNRSLPCYSPVNIPQPPGNFLHSQEVLGEFTYYRTGQDSTGQDNKNNIPEKIPGNDIVEVNSSLKVRKRNVYWEAICEVFGFKGQTVAEKKRIGKLSRDFEIKSPNADQFLEDLKSQMITYRQSMPKMQLTPDAILRHWDSLKANKIIESEEERTKKWLNTQNLKEKP